MEKIKNIEITNFKSIKHLKIDGCNKINVFIGQPNAGKSNILEALGLFGSLNEGLSPFIRYNKNDELFFEGDILTDIKIKLDNVVLNIIDKNNKTDNSNFNQYKDIMIPTLGFDENLFFGYYVIKNDKKSIFDEEQLSIRYDKKDCRDIKYYNFNKQFELKETFNQIDEKHVSGYDKLGYLLSRESKLREEIKKIFDKNNLKFLVEKNTEEIKIFKEYQDGTVFILPYNMIADTLQRLIFYKAAIMSNSNSTLLFEEPEAHCFEPYILEFTNSVKYDENDNQFFIVTHSEFIIQEFLRDEESKENTNIYLVNNVDGETKVKLLDKKNNDDVYEFGMNPFFNFENLWDNN
ncbi:AAA family ATPase [Flavobacterium sp.]|uniref:AAA family ATPase n=1 Tax=Flavobacterium sp. TaxID=239 RepID=UPI0037500762